MERSWSERPREKVRPPARFGQRPGIEPVGWLARAGTARIPVEVG